MTTFFALVIVFWWPEPHAKLPDVKNNRIMDIYLCGSVYHGSDSEVSALFFFSPVTSNLMTTVMIRPPDSFCMPNLCILLRMTTVSKCATFFIRAHLSMRDAIKEHHKASYKFLRELITKTPSGSFCAFVFWFCNAKHNASLSKKKKKMCCNFMVVWKASVNLVIFYFFHTPLLFSRWLTRMWGPYR